MSKSYIIGSFKSYMYRAIQRLFATEGLQADQVLLMKLGICIKQSTMTSGQ